MEHSHSAFTEDFRLLAQGEPATVARAVDAALRATPTARVLVFDDATGKVVDLDWTSGEALPPAAPAEEARSGPGRPKLGVVSREVSLLPQHWEWLGTQPGGASVTLRRLVEAARKERTPKQIQEVVYRVMHGLAGDLPGFEEASRALFANRWTDFFARIAYWPPDLVAYLRRLSGQGM